MFELDRKDALVPTDLGAEPFRDRQLRIDASLRANETRPGLVVRELVTVQRELGKASGHLCRIEALVRNPVVVRGGDRR